MNVKKLLALLLALVMVAVSLAACGAAYENTAADDGYYDYEMPMEEAVVEEDMSFDEAGLSSTTDNTPALPENQKIITTMNLDAQTEDMDPLLEKINAKITQLGGYLESQEIYNGSTYDSYSYRYAYLTIRIPADQLNDFVALVKEQSNVVSQNISTENVTLSYVAIESRIKALETEQTRLLELLAKAENMEDLLMIESRLTEVRGDLEQYTSQLRVMDNRINYSTIHLDLEEVKEYTPVEEEPKTVWERIGSGLSKNLKSLGNGLVNFFVWIVVSLPFLLPLAAIVVVTILLIRRNSKKKKNTEKKA